MEKQHHNKNNMNSNKKNLSPEQREQLLKTLKARFEKNMNRHKGLEWAKVQAKLEANTEKLWSLNEMESTGGEPDVVGHDKKTGKCIFMIVQRKVLKAVEVSVTITNRSLDRMRLGGRHD